MIAGGFNNIEVRLQVVHRSLFSPLTFPLRLPPPALHRPVPLSVVAAGHRQPYFRVLPSQGEIRYTFASRRSGVDPLGSRSQGNGLQFYSKFIHDALNSNLFPISILLPDGRVFVAANVGAESPKMLGDRLTDSPPHDSGSP